MSKPETAEGSIYINLSAATPRAACYQVINGRWMRPPLALLDALVVFLKKARSGKVSDKDIAEIMSKSNRDATTEDAELLTGHGPP